jgi:hypothetical protein
MVSLPFYNPDGLQSSTYTNSVLLAANVPESFSVPLDEHGIRAKFVTFGKGAAADFYARAFTPYESADRVTNGTFAEDEDWTKGAGWTIGSGVATATGGISTALSQTANITTPLVQGQAYLCTFTATRSAGSVTLSVGGTAGTARSSGATFAEVLIAGSTQAISFGTSGFTGTIDNVTIVACASVPVDATAGLSAIQNPGGFVLGGNYDLISVVSAGTPTITASFYK